MTASAISGAAEGAVHEAAPWVEKLARLGFVARALLYMTIGALATAMALRLGGAPKGATGQRGAMGTLLAAPAGRGLLVIIAIGLFGYAAWRFAEAAFDPTHKMKGAKGIAMRIRSVALGAVQVALGASALKIALGHADAADDGRGSTHWIGRALHEPGGKYALYAVAAGFIGSGGYQLYKAWKAKLDKELMLGRLSASVRRFVIGASRFGIAARGVVFGTTGLLIARAVHHRNPNEVKGSVKTSLLELQQFSRIAFAVIAVGLVAYGIYQLIEARYRRIEVC